MKIHRAYRYELDPNTEQRILLAKHAGAARFAYNRGLARWI
ncbi:helix-turn-helix domain-containing protein [Hydrogenibacillus schlegelii]